MAEVVWRTDARRQLREIAFYIRARSPNAAIAYAQGLREASDGLASFPDQGRRYDARYRVIVYRDHLVFYMHDQHRNLVEISAIIDGRRDAAEIMRSLPRN